jgi:hypothetical protein
MNLPEWVLLARRPVKFSAYKVKDGATIEEEV